MAATPIGRSAAEHGLATIKPGDVNDADTVRRVRQAGADALVIIAFGQKLGRELAEKRLVHSNAVLEGCRVRILRGQAVTDAEHTAANGVGKVAGVLSEQVE